MQSWKYYPPKQAPQTRLNYLAFVCEELEGSAVTNDPTDKGGLTKWGITLSFYVGWLESMGMDTAGALTALRFMTKDEAISIYGSAFYHPYKDLPERVAIFICDMAINHGHKMATTIAQTAWNKVFTSSLTKLNVDGAWGPRTNKAMMDYLDENTYMSVIEARGEFISIMQDLRQLHYADICVADPSQLKYLAGWMLRTMRFSV